MKDEVVFYAMEAEHLELLKSVAKRLYTENRMDGNEMRDAAHSVMSVVRYAESLSALRGAKELYTHLLPNEYREIAVSDIGKAIFEAFGRKWSVDFIGQITQQDVGKRVYLHGDVLQVENQDQFISRLMK